MAKNSNFIILILLLTGCLSPNDNPEICTINIRPSSTDILKLSQEAEDLYYIQLETGEGYFIGKISKTIFHKGLIFILDSWINKAVYIFNEEGSFLSKINDLGDGPGEFREPRDITINKQTGTLLLYDHSHKKILEYSLKGSFFREWPVNLDFHKFICIDDRTLGFYTNNKYNYSDSDPYLSYQVLIYRKDEGIIGKNISHDATLNHGKPSFSFDNEFFRNGDKVLINWALNDTVYEIVDYLLHPRFVFNFGRHAIPSYEKKDVKNLIDKINNHQYGCINSPVFYLNDELFFKYNIKGKSGYSRYNIKTDEIRYFSDIKNDIDDGIFNIPSTIWNGRLVIVNYPEALYEKNPGRQPHLIGCDKSIQAFDNPILMIIKLKQSDQL